MSLVTPRKGYKLVPWLFGKEIEIPEEWEVKKAVNISKKISVGIATSTTKYIVEEGGIPLLRNQNITEEKIDIQDLQYISKEFAQENFSKQLHEGDIISTRTGYVGRSAVVLHEMNGWQTFTTLIITPNTEFVTSTYFSRFLNSRSAKKQYTSFQAGSSQQNLNAGEISNVLFLLPSLPEQQKITSILSNVDNLIDSTVQIIENSKSLKKGLMQKLLTRGIGHTKFKKVPWLFGKEIEIPEEWAFETLTTFVTIQSGEYFQFNEFSKKGVPVLKIDNVMHGKIEWETKTFLDKKYLDSHKEIVLNQGDIVLALNRPITHNQVKVAQLTVEDSPSILYQRVGRFIFKNKHINKDFFYTFLSSPFFKKLLSGILIGTDQPYVRTTELLTKHIPFPSLPEQQKIASILSNVDSKITSQIQYKEKLERLKKSLMQKLLTGMVRV